MPSPPDARPNPAPTDSLAVTQLLRRADGDSDAFDALLPLVYEELRRIAHRQLLRVGSRQTLHTTALVHEAYLKLVDQAQACWEDRAHFFAVSAKAMRHILIDYARARSTQKRGGGTPDRPLSLAEGVPDPHQCADALLALDDALQHLSTLDERIGRVVELRFYGGLDDAEVAQVLGISERTVRRDWTKARMLLGQMLRDG